MFHLNKNISSLKIINIGSLNPIFKVHREMTKQKKHTKYIHLFY